MLPLLLLVTLPALAAAPPPRPAEPPEHQPRMGFDLPPERCERSGCETTVFFRPADCRLKRRTRTRRTFTCEREARLEVTHGRHIENTRRLPDAKPRNPYPFELIGQWRRCPYHADNDLARIAVPYEDPDVGRCYVLRLDRPLDPPPRQVGDRLLEKVHPYIAECIRDMIARSWAEGDHVRVISGLRPPRKRRKGGRKVWAGGGWHAFGLAVDIYVGRYEGLKAATRAYLSGRDRAIWERLGERGEACGLKWLGRSDPGEIFHFEWHPGWPGMPRGKLYQRLATTQDRRGSRAVWSELRYRRSRPTAFRHLRDRR